MHHRPDCLPGPDATVYSSKLFLMQLLWDNPRVLGGRSSSELFMMLFLRENSRVLGLWEKLGRRRSSETKYNIHICSYY